MLDDDNEDDHNDDDENDEDNDKYDDKHDDNSDDDYYQARALHHIGESTRTAANDVCICKVNILELAKKRL